MTLPGGAADRLGNRYETWWTLSELVRMLRGKTEAIRIEDRLVSASTTVDLGRRLDLEESPILVLAAAAEAAGRPAVLIVDQ